MTTSTRRETAQPVGTSEVPAPPAIPESPSRQGAPLASFTDGVLDPSLQPGAAESLPPVFPLEDRGTALVLYAGPAGEMRIHWRLERDDFERAAGSFPVAGQRPTVVLRLRRDRPQGGSDQADEISLAGVRAGTGERGLRVPADHGRYHAELGLTNADGGWLMLARSNGFYNAVGIGLALVRQSDEGLARESRLAPPGWGWAARPGADPPVAGGEAPVEPALAAGEVAPVEGGLPLVPWDPGRLGGRAPAPVSAGADSGGSRSLQGYGASGHAAEDLAAAGGGGEGMASPGEGGGSSRPPSSPAVLAPASGPSPGAAASRAPESDAMRIGVSREPLTYERPPERVNGVELEAELRIIGRAKPGSTLDLFGYPYRVGPGGRFQLVLPVTNPEILRRALEAAPPAELSGLRED